MKLKTFRRAIISLSVIVIIMMMSGYVQGGEPPLIDISISLDKGVYLPDEPIEVNSLNSGP